MSRIRVSASIPASPRRVWADLRDIASHVEWMEDAVAIRFDSSRTSGVGTIFNCDTKVGPVRLTDRMEVTEWVPGEVMGIRHVGLVTGDGRFRLKRRWRGGTTFIWEERLFFPWYMGGPVGALVGSVVLRRIWRRNLANLRTRFTD
ncbi:MAG: SRPBCC family protein [Acidimicrobiales bacterium]